MRDQLPVLRLRDGQRAAAFWHAAGQWCDFLACFSANTRTSIMMDSSKAGFVLQQTTVAIINQASIGLADEALQLKLPVVA